VVEMVLIEVVNEMVEVAHDLMTLMMLHDLTMIHLRLMVAMMMILLMMIDMVMQ
jgi:hypothetical protein